MHDLFLIISDPFHIRTNFNIIFSAIERFLDEVFRGSSLVLREQKKNRIK